MNYVVFNARVAALRFAADIDAELGYPKSATAVVGRSGRTLSSDFGRTERHGDIAQNQARGEWAYPDDAVVMGKRGRVPLPAGAASRALENDWEPPMPAAVSKAQSGRT